MLSSCVALNSWSCGCVRWFYRGSNAKLTKPHLKIGRFTPQKETRKYSKHPFSGAFAVSFREGHIFSGVDFGAFGDEVFSSFLAWISMAYRHTSECDMFISLKISSEYVMSIWGTCIYSIPWTWQTYSHPQAMADLLTIYFFGNCPWKPM